MTNLTLSSAMKGSFILILLIAATIVSAKSGDVTELQIGVKHRPASCEVQAHKGDKIKVHYRGKLTDGSVFDSSFERGTPFEFELGSGQVIKGWDQGLLGMCVGEKRKLKIPAKMGYGERGSPPKIPGGATLIFDTELIAVNGKGAAGGDIDNISAKSGDVTRVTNHRKGYSFKLKVSIRLFFEHLIYYCGSISQNLVKSRHTKGKLTDGSVFDSSFDRGTPIEFTLGIGQGLLGMCVGEKRQLTIPAKMAYEERGHPPVIPGGATLIFDTELIAVNGKGGDKNKNNNEL
ncbi:hypothetical protein L2E82_00437 [Cichorium intybus]|uniref:Uncharacterized protein n=1 Tax=Cichorium intybus TaxID=13427 RepID=A0ACB9GXX5_CICIN|nr:hypothetical protein L2E82_00437 [Cichorium intybus]